MKLLMMFAMGSLLAASCSSSKNSAPQSTNAETIVRTSVSNGFSLLTAIEGFNAELSCTGASDVIILDETSSSTSLYGDDLSTCSVELKSYTANGIEHDVSLDGYQVSPSKSINLGSYTPGEDIEINFAVNEIAVDESEIIITDFTTTEVSVGVSVTEAPDYDVTKVEVVVLDPLNLGVKISYDCNDCDTVKIAIGNNPGTDIGLTELNAIHSSTVEAIEGDEISSSGSVTYRLEDLGLSAATLDSVDLIFSMRKEGEDSFKYVNILSRANATVECGVSGQEQDYTGGKLLSSEGYECNKFLGSLRIINTQLTTLTDLSSLTSIESLVIASNPLLEDLNGLENISEIGVFNLSVNPKITSISQFTKVTEMESLLISQMDELIDISGFANIESVSQDLSISFMKKLTDLSPLSKLKVVGDDFSIMYTDELLSLNGLQNLESVSDIISIFSNKKLADISALSNLSGTITGSLGILLNESLQSLSGLENLEGVNSLDINQNAVLNDISALSGLTVEQTASVVANPMLGNADAIVASMNVKGSTNVAENGTGLN